MKTPSLLTALGAGLLLPLLCQAGPSKSFRVTSYKDFAEGQESGVLLSSEGALLPGFASARLALPSVLSDSVRALAQGADGTVYVGTSGDGPAILTYSKGALRPFAKLDAQTWITALCALPSGDLLAATAQDGRVFLVGRDGKSRVLARAEGDHVWALRHDPRRGVAYAATGPGRVYEIDLARGRAEKIFDSGAKQILALEQTSDGALYVGTADDAVLYRLERGPHKWIARAVHDFAGNELRAVAQSGSALYVAVNDMSRGQSAGGVKITPATPGTVPGVGSRPGAPAPLGDRSGKGALYRIDGSGRVEQLHAVTDGFFNAIQADEGGNLYAAASTPGGRGKVFWIRPDRTVLTALELKESDVLALLWGKGQRLLGTGNSGALYRVDPDAPKDAHYLSKVFDGQSPARWGSVRYSGTGGLRLESRSGNVARPDDHWSVWEALARPTPGGGGTGDQVGKVVSPPGRYLQIRVNLTDRSAALQDFSLSYQPINQRARLTEVQIGEDPLGRIARAPKGAKGRLVKLKFKVENPDEDELVYRLYVRAVRGGGRAPTGLEDDWLRLGGPDPLSKPEYEWNTESVPDGVYELKVVASDERQNPADQALSHEMITAPFLVDSRRPDLQGLRYSDQDGGTLSGRAVDNTSPLLELAYSVDGGDFLPIGARDGVLDDLVEDFSFRLPRLSPGPHTVVVRAVDGADNLTTQQMVIRVREQPSK